MLDEAGRLTRMFVLIATALAGTLCLAGCGAKARLPVSAGTGPAPQLPHAETSLIPLIKVATAAGWDEGDAPVAAEGLTVNAFATGLNHPRWLYVLPNGDVLVAETNAPDRPDDNEGLKGKFF